MERLLLGTLTKRSHQALLLLQRHAALLLLALLHHRGLLSVLLRHTAAAGLWRLLC